MQATSLLTPSDQPFQKRIEFMRTQLNIAQRTNPAATLIGIPFGSTLPSYVSDLKLLTSIFQTAINIQEVRG